jgi:hypothetical protein
MITRQAIKCGFVDSNCSGCRGGEHIGKKMPRLLAGAQHFEIFRRDQ